jgi:hypothetical protein
MVHVACVMTWHPCHGPMHCHRSQCSDTYLDAIHGSQGKCHIPMFVDMAIYEYMDPNVTSQIPR